MPRWCVCARRVRGRAGVRRGGARGRAGGTLRGMVSCTMTSASAAIRLRSSSTASTEPEGSGLAAPFLPPRCEDMLALM